MIEKMLPSSSRDIDSRFARSRFSTTSSVDVVARVGRVERVRGGYEDWLRQRKPEAPVAPIAKPARRAAERESTRPRKIGFKEKRELGELPGRIEALEGEKQRLYSIMASPTFYASPGNEIAQVKQQLGHQASCRRPTRAGRARDLGAGEEEGGGFCRTCGSCSN